jgi:hypothetical protein
MRPHHNPLPEGDRFKTIVCFVGVRVIEPYGYDKLRD